VIVLIFCKGTKKNVYVQKKYKKGYTITGTAPHKNNLKTIKNNRSYDEHLLVNANPQMGVLLNIYHSSGLFVR